MRDKNLITFEWSVLKLRPMTIVVWCVWQTTCHLGINKHQLCLVIFRLVEF